VHLLKAHSQQVQIYDCVYRSTATTNVGLSISQASPVDFWPVADLQCHVFYPEERGSNAFFRRLERVCSMELDEKLQQPKEGRYARRPVLYLCW
jgi:hypothetical protein